MTAKDYKAVKRYSYTEDDFAAIGKALGVELNAAQRNTLNRDVQNYILDKNLILENQPHFTKTDIITLGTKTGAFRSYLLKLDPRIFTSVDIDIDPLLQNLDTLQMECIYRNLRAIIDKDRGGRKGGRPPELARDEFIKVLTTRFFEITSKKAGQPYISKHISPLSQQPISEPGDGNTNYEGPFLRFVLSMLSPFEFNISTQRTAIAKAIIKNLTKNR